MATRTDNSQIRKLYVGTDTETSVADGNAIITGNVGIGTTNPGALLDVGGGDGTPNGTQFTSVVKGTSTRTMYFDGGGSSGASVWWGDGNTPQFAIDSVSGGGAAMWVHASSAWYRIVDVAANGNVGIGTDSPSYRLQIGVAGGLADSIRIGSYAVATNTRQYIGYARADTGLFESSGNGDTPSTVLAGVSGIRIVNTTGTLSSGNSDNSVQLLTHIYNGDSRVALHASYNGNVGIGTTAPAKKLSVQTIDTATYDPAVNAAEVSVTRANTSNTAAQVAGISLNATGWSGGTTGVVVLNAIQQQGNYSNADFAIQNRVGGSFVETFRITAYGDVGIANSSPGSLLHIGTYASAGKYVDSSTLPTTPANHLITLAPPSTAGYYGGGIAWSEGTDVAASINAYDAGSGGALGLVFSTGNNTTLSERMRITSAGELQVTGNGVIKNEHSSANYSYWQQTGSDARLFVQYAQPLIFGTNAAEKMRISSAGNVSIGNTNDTYKLDVTGQGRLTHSAGVPALDIRASDTNFALMSIFGNQTGDVNWLLMSGYPIAGDFTIRQSDTVNALTLTKTTGAATFSSSVTASSLIKSGGTASQYLMADGSVSTLTNPVTGTGTTNYVPKWTSGSAIGNSNIYDNAGNIGIGVTNADYPLTVGSINVGGAGASLGIVINSVIGTAIPASSVKAIIGATNSGFGYAAGSLLIQPRTGVNAVTVFTTEGTEKMRLTHDGNVGIGTDSPDTKLMVSGEILSENSNGGYFISTRVPSSSSRPTLNFYGTALDVNYVTGYAGGGASTAVTILSGGNVGIGTTGPVDELHVEGVIQSKKQLLPSTSGTAGWYKIGTMESFVQGGSTAVIEIAGHEGYNATNTQDYLIKLFIKTSNGSGSGPQLQKYNSWYERTGGNASSIELKWNNSATNDYDLYMYIPIHSLRSYYSVTKGTGTWVDIGTSATDPGVNSTTVLKATSLFNILDSNVGIGTTSPGYPLEISSNTSTSFVYQRTGVSANKWGFHSDNDATYWQNVTSGSLLFTLQNGGNVGIGTTSPDSKLDVTGGDITVNTSGTGFMNFKYGAVGSETARGSITTDGIDLKVNATADLLLLPTGNVGIGTTAPAKKLTIIGGTGGTEEILRAYNGNATYSTAGVALGVSGHEGEVSVYDAYGTKKIYLSGYYDSYINPRAGNVGIGTTSPGYKLDVNGGVNVSFGDTNGYRINTNRVLSQISGAVEVGVLDYKTTYPNISFNNDNTFRVEQNGSTKIIVNSTGNVGIGTTAPDSKFHVEDANPEVRITGTSGTSFPRILWEYPVSATQASRWALTSSASGNTFYLYNYTQSKKIIQVDGTASHITLNHDLAGTTQIGTATTQTAYQLYVKTNAGQTGAIEASGSVKITTGALGVNIAASATAGRIDASNDIVAYSTSDKRLKENITPITNALEKVRSLTGVEFDWKQETESVHGYEGHDVGVIAQEVQAVLPEAVRTNESGYLSVRYEKMIALLVEAMKEQQVEIDELKKLIK